MNKIAKEKTMTIKEISQMLGVSRDLIEKRVKEFYPNKMKKGVTTHLNQMEVTFIKMRIQENSSLATSDDRRKLDNMPKTQLEKNLIIQQAFSLLKEEETLLRVEIDQLKQEKLINAPKVEYHDEVLSTKNAFTTQQVAEELGFTAQVLNKILKEKKIQYKKSGQYMLYAEYKGCNYTKTRTKTFKRKNGDIETTHYTVWTEKGRQFIHDLTKKEVCNV